MATKMQQRRGTSAQWSAANPVMADGEFGIEKDTGVVKVGNGTSTWNQLTPILASSYLGVGGKAFDSERLDGIDSTDFYQKSLNTLCRDRGTGTAFPTTDLLRGDHFDHRGINSLFVYQGPALSWRQVGVTPMSGNTERSSLLGAYGLYLPNGFQIWHQGLKVVQTWDSSSQLFRFILNGSSRQASDVNGFLVFPHNGGQLPRFVLGATASSGSDAQNSVLSVKSWDFDATNITLRAYRTDTNVPFPGQPGLGYSWSASF